MHELTFYVDGGLLGRTNPSPEGIFWSVYCVPPGRVVLREESKVHTTNNEAEWLALQAALKYATKRGATDITIRSDSRLVVNMFNRSFRPREGRMMILAQQSWYLARNFNTCNVEWVPRKVMVKLVGH